MTLGPRGNPWGERGGGGGCTRGGVPAMPEVLCACGRWRLLL